MKSRYPVPRVLVGLGRSEVQSCHHHRVMIIIIMILSGILKLSCDHSVFTSRIRAFKFLVGCRMQLFKGWSAGPGVTVRESRSESARPATRTRSLGPGLGGVASEAQRLGSSMRLLHVEP